MDRTNPSSSNSRTKRTHNGNRARRCACDASPNNDLDWVIELSTMLSPDHKENEWSARCMFVLTAMHGRGWRIELTFSPHGAPFPWMVSPDGRIYDVAFDGSVTDFYDALYAPLEG